MHKNSNQFFQLFKTRQVLRKFSILISNGACMALLKMYCIQICDVIIPIFSNKQYFVKNRSWCWWWVDTNMFMLTYSIKLCMYRIRNQCRWILHKVTSTLMWNFFIITVYVIISTQTPFYKFSLSHFLSIPAKYKGKLYRILPFVRKHGPSLLNCRHRNCPSGTCSGTCGSSLHLYVTVAAYFFANKQNRFCISSAEFEISVGFLGPTASLLLSCLFPLWDKHRCFTGQTNKFANLLNLRKMKCRIVVASC